MTRDLQVHAGETCDDIGARVISAWHRMERGEAVNEKHISFETWETMVRVLSPKSPVLMSPLGRAQTSFRNHAEALTILRLKSCL